MPSGEPLRINLLGGFEASRTKGLSVKIVARKTRALLACLALAAGKPQGRDKLANLLWSDRGDKQARDSLRQALTDLRDALADLSPALTTHDDTVWLDRAVVDVDALSFESLAGSPEAADLRRAADLYGGDLLDGIGVKDPAFEEWIGGERQHYRELAVATLKKLLAQEHGTAALTVAQQLLTLDPLQEDGHRALMRAYAESGDIAMALRQYEVCRDALKRDLDIAPSPQTAALLQQIKEQSTARPPSDLVTGPALDAPLQSPASTSKPSVAVLPFKNLSGDPEQQYFSDGITEDIITELSRFHSLIVIARNSSFQYRDEATEVRSIARDLNVQYVVEGSVRKSGNRLRVTAQLVEATSGKHLWAERYDRDLEDIFAVQDDVTQMIVSALAIKLEDDQLAIAKRKPPGSLRAYDLWLRGNRCLDRWTADGNSEARRHFEKALEIDPDFARAVAGLAITYEWGNYYTAWEHQTQRAHQIAVELALKAVALDDTDHQPHVVLAWLYQSRRDFERARKHLDRATALNPNDADALINKAMILVFQGDAENGLALAKSAVRLNPYHPDWYFCYLGGCCFQLRQFNEALVLLEKGGDAVPESPAFLAATYAHLGRLDDAHRQLSEFLNHFSSHWIGQPTASQFAQLLPFRLPEHFDLLCDGLRKAGMPD